MHIHFTPFAEMFNKCSVIKYNKYISEAYNLIILNNDSLHCTMLTKKR